MSKLWEEINIQLRQALGVANADDLCWQIWVAVHGVSAACADKTEASRVEIVQRSSLAHSILCPLSQRFRSAWPHSAAALTFCLLDRSSVRAECKMSLNGRNVDGIPGKPSAP